MQGTPGIHAQHTMLINACVLLAHGRRLPVSLAMRCCLARLSCVQLTQSLDIANNAYTANSKHLL